MPQDGQTGLSLVSPYAVEPGRVLRLILRSPEGEWSSLATVARSTRMPGAGESTSSWLLGLRVDGQRDVVGLRQILSAESLV